MCVLNSWRLESSDFGYYEWSDLLLAFSWSAEFRPQEASSELDSIPKTSLFHGGVCSSDVERITAVQKLDCPGTDTTNVGFQEHDVCS